MQLRLSSIFYRAPIRLIEFSGLIKRVFQSHATRFLPRNSRVEAAERSLAAGRAPTGGEVGRRSGEGAVG